MTDRKSKPKASASFDTSNFKRIDMLAKRDPQTGTLKITAFGEAANNKKTEPSANK